VQLSGAEAQIEYERSFSDFDRLFGQQRHFAFPFGTPGLEFNAGHVEALRRMNDWIIWSTERRPYSADERRPGAVLPRYPINCAWSYKQTGAWIAALALKFRGTDTRFHF
jgi:hypothetical protein